MDFFVGGRVGGRMGCWVLLGVVGSSCWVSNSLTYYQQPDRLVHFVIPTLINGVVVGRTWFVMVVSLNLTSTMKTNFKKRIPSCQDPDKYFPGSTKVV